MKFNMIPPKILTDDLLINSAGFLNQRDVMENDFI
jgi:hypothetical protein